MGKNVASSEIQSFIGRIGRELGEVSKWKSKRRWQSAQESAATAEAAAVESAALKQCCCCNDVCQVCCTCLGVVHCFQCLPLVAAGCVFCARHYILSWGMLVEF